MIYRIKAARKEVGMTQEELSKKSGVSRAIISGLESGRCTVTTTETLIKISRTLGKPVTDIFIHEVD